MTDPWSWRVCAGQNPAYDQFNCQYQIFYRGKGKGVLWYVPVFNVETLGSGDGDGGSKKRVWRKRKYRVKRGEVPGTFWFSVLDNGKRKREERREEKRREKKRGDAERKKRGERKEKTKNEKKLALKPFPLFSKNKTPKTPNRRRRLQGVLDYRLRAR